MYEEKKKKRKKKIYIYINHAIFPKVVSDLPFEGR